MLAMREFYTVMNKKDLHYQKNLCLGKFDD